jgi:hypothetical protein
VEEVTTDDDGTVHLGRDNHAPREYAKRGGT